MKLIKTLLLPLLLHLWLVGVILLSTSAFTQQVTFTEATGTPFDGVRYSSIAFADVDGNSYQDVLVTGINSSNQRIAKLYTNDGNGNFTEVIGTPFDAVQWSSIAFADVNGNGYQDVLITGQNSSSQRTAKLYTNDGNGNFTEVIGTPFDGVQSSSIAFADVNGNGYQDVLITGENSSLQRIAKLYTNDGNGNFTEVIGTPFDGVRISSIAFADVNGNSYQDILITGWNSSNQQIAKLYTNDGNGNFTEVIGTPFDAVQWSSIAFADVNGNGYQDVLITGWGSGRIAKLYINDGNGNFTEVIGTPFDAVHNSSIAFADINGNGKQDVLITGENSSVQRIAKLYINDSGTSIDHTVSQKSISIFPNPTNNWIEIRLENKNIQHRIFNLYDISGKLLFTNTFSGDHYTFQLENYANLFYRNC